VWRRFRAEDDFHLTGKAMILILLIKAGNRSTLMAELAAAMGVSAICFGISDGIAGCYSRGTVRLR
jgi:hypothetical protein